MRKIFSVCMLVIVMLLPVVVKAQVVIVNESFENGIPETWTQEYVIGEQPWVVETGGTLPTGAIAGEKRAVLRNETGQTKGYKTRLVSPVMNLKTDADGNPIPTPFVSFFYAADKWTGDFDTLRVLYRLDPKSDWEDMAIFTGDKVQRQWTKKLFDLPGASETTTYQIAFEGADNLGRGIVLDSVLVRSAIDCTTPYSLYTRDMNNGIVTIGWQASYDAEAFEIAIANAPIDINSQDLTDDKVVVFNDTVAFNPNMVLTTPSLPTNVDYYVYMRSLCETETSEWSEAFVFYMTPQVTVPYIVNFNLSAKDQTLSRIPEWSYGGNVDAFVPSVNTHMLTGLGNYSNDNTYALIFTGGNNVDINIPGGSYIYAVTPELTGENINNLQVNFWGTTNTASRRTQARSLTIGVMSDPNNIFTFTPIKTVTIDGYQEKKEFTVSLAEYTGEGKRVAFVSQFDKPNQFYIDNLTISKIADVQKVEDVAYTPAAKSLSFKWQTIQGETYHAVLSDKLVDAGKAPESIVKEIDANQGEASFTELAEKTDYYLYIQSKKGETSVWSNAKKVRTLATKELPMNFGFETSEAYTVIPGTTRMIPSEIALYTTGQSTPYNRVNTGHSSSYSLFLSQEAGYDSWAVFPEVADVKSLYMLFFHSASAETYVAESQLIVGVMDNPADLSTFTSIETFRGNATYTRCYVDFSQYTGTGKYIAMRWLEPTGAANCVNYVDDILIAELGDCSIPNNIDVKATSSSAEITWNAPGADKFNVRVSSIPMNESQLDFVSGNIYNALNLEGAKAVVESGLEWSTRYYVYVQSVCANGDKSLWNSSVFTTDCIEKMPLPYTIDFEGDREGGRGEGFYQSCWTRNNDYPYIRNSDTNNDTHAGKGCIMLRANVDYNTWVAAPALDGDLQDVVLTFWAKNYSQYPLLIGVMTDQNDFSTFQVVDTVAISSGYSQHTVYLNKYEGTGKYVCFYNPSTTSGYSSTYIDDVVFKSEIDIAPHDLQITETEKNKLSFSWEGKSSDGKFIVLLTSAAQNNPEVPAASAVVEKDTISGTTKTFEELESNTRYYVYVKAANGAEWISMVCRTACDVLQLSYTENFEDPDWRWVGTASYKLGQNQSHTSWTEDELNEYTPKCWVVGNPAIASLTNSARNNIPHIYYNANANTNGVDQVLYFYNTATNYLGYAAMPEIDIEDISRLTVKFAVQGTAGKSFVVGVMDNPDDITTFTPVDSVVMTGLGANQSKYYEIELAEYTGKGKHIAFRGQLEKASNTYYLDDISLKLSTCTAPRPSYNNLTDKSVRVSVGLSQRNRRDWVVYYAEKELSLDSLNAGSKEYLTANNVKIEEAEATDVMVQINGLEPSSTYYFYAASKCDENTYSAFKAVNNPVKTLCSPSDPTAFSSNGTNVETFEAFKVPATNADSCRNASMGCWRFGNRQNTGTTYSVIPQIAKTTDAMKAGGMTSDQCLKIYTSTSFTNAFVISPALDVEDISQYQVRFKACTGVTNTTTYENKLIVGIMSDPSDLSTIVKVDTISFLSALSYNVGNFTAPLAGALVDNISKYKHFVLLSDFTMDNQVYIDDVVFEKIPACTEPTELTIVDGSLTENSFSISWTAPKGTFNAYIAKEFTLEPENYTKFVQKVTTDTTVATFENLPPSSQYYVFVENICDEGNIWSTERLLVRTDCPAEGFEITKDTPYKQDFEDFAASNFDAGSCWNGRFYMATDTKAVQESYTHPQINTGNGHLAPYCIYMYAALAKTNNTGGYASYMVLPEFKNSLKELQISFYYKANALANTSSYTPAAADRRILLAVTDEKPTKENIATLEYTILDEIISTSTSYEYYSRTLDDYTGNGKYLMLINNYGSGKSTASSAGGGGVYVDELKVDLIPTCFMPSRLTVPVVGHKVAEVKITPNEAVSATSWELAYLPDTVELESEDQIDELATIVATSNTTTILEGLNHTANYNLYVRTVCSADDKSLWLGPVAFSTLPMLSANQTWTFEENEPTHQAGGTTTTSTVVPKYWNTNQITTYQYASQVPQRIKNSTGDGTVRYSYEGDYAFALYNYSTDQTNQAVDSSYAILPAFDMEGQKQISMYVRAGQVVSSKPAVEGVDTVTYGLDAQLQIGLVDSLGTIQTFKAISTYTLSSRLGEKATAANDKLFTKIVVTLPEKMNGRQVAILRPDRVYKLNAIINIDNLAIEDATGVITPSISLAGSSDGVTAKWAANGETKWNVYLIEGLTTLKEADKSKVTKYEVTEPQMKFTNLSLNSVYSIYVEIADKADKAGALSPRAIYKTATCAPLSVGQVIKFEDDERELLENNYYYPTCWVVGNANSGESVAREGSVGSGIYNRMPYLSKNNAPTESLQSKYTLPGSDSTALCFYGGSTAGTDGAYAIMPLVDGNLDELQLEFYMRGIYEGSYGSPGSLSGLYDYQDQSIVIGSVTDPSDFSTFVALDTADYTYRPNEDLISRSGDAQPGTALKDDPAGLKYFQKKVIPLKGIKGDYIVFYQPSKDRSAIYLEDVSVNVRSGIVAPNSLKSANVDSVSVDLSWKGYQSGKYVVRIATDRALVNKVDEKEVEGTSLHVTNLDASTRYFWSVKQLGEGSDESQWGSIERFVTLSKAVDANYSTGFEMEEGWYQLPGFYNDNYKVTNGWYSGTAATNASFTNRVRNAVNDEIGSKTATIGYSHRGNYTLEINTTTGYNGAYAVMPPLATDRMDTLQVNFYMGAAPYYTGGTNAGKVQTNFTTSTYAHAIEVGTCTNPTDQSTFVPIDTVYYLNTFTGTTANVSNEANDYRYEFKSVSLTKAVGKYIYFRSNFPMNNHVYIDDVTISQYNGCLAPTVLRTEDITATSAKLSWSHYQGEKWQVEIATDIDFKNVVLTSDSLTTDSYEPTTLEPNSTYYWRVQQFCGGESASDLSNIAIFETWKAPLFDQDFIGTIDNSWINDKAQAQVKAVVAGEAAAPTELGSAWGRQTNGNGLATSHYTSTMTSVGSAWLVTPVIQLNATDTAMLQFDIAVTTTGTKNAIIPVNTMADNQFMVLISEDAGKSWSLDNATIWNNDTIDDPTHADYHYGIAENSLWNIATDGQTERINLLKYQGKPIRIAFVTENIKANVAADKDMDVHIDNIHVNYFNTINQEVEICQFEDYENEIFNYFIDGDNVEAGEVELTYAKLARETGINDTLYVMTASVKEAPFVELQSTIRQGQTYSEYGFEAISASGVYKQKLTSAVTGCDSVTILTLNVLQPIVIDNGAVTICTEQLPYVMNGEEYTRSGLYKDTVFSTSNEQPDTIYQVVLTVVQTFEKTIDVTICHNSTYSFGGEDYAETGEFVHTFTSTAGCDSVVTLNLTVLPELVDTIVDFISEGEIYNKGDFTNLTEPGFYTINYTTELGCDSVVVLDLRLTTGLGMLNGSTLLIKPNMIEPNEMVTIDYQFTPNELQGMHVDVFDMTGKRVSSKEITTVPVQVNTFPLSGFYSIRITTGTGNCYNGRVVVK